jgi:hypothetical protein
MYYCLSIKNINKNCITNDTNIEMYITDSLTCNIISSFCVKINQLIGDDQTDTNLAEKQMSIFNMFMYNVLCDIDDSIYFQHIDNKSGIKITYCSNQQVILITFKSVYHSFTVSILSEMCTSDFNLFY